MPVKHPNVAVLLAAFNGMQWIEEQLTSILRQSKVKVTIYISIDPSSDGTEAWCAAYANKHSQVIVLPSGEIFGGASRNFFRLIRDVDISAYDFISFADQDDIWHSDKLQRATETINNLQLDAYSSNVRAFWPDGRTQLLDKAQPQVTWDYLFESAGPGCSYVMSKAFVLALKASMLENWQALQAITLHDWYIYAFARSHGFRWFIDPMPSVEYRQHGSNQVGANTGLIPLITRYRRIYNGWWFSQVKKVALLVGQDDQSFVKSWFGLGRLKLIKLSFSAGKCRRRRRDKFFFFFVCWATALLGSRAE
jgi:rhamnosyltransferase